MPSEHGQSGSQLPRATDAQLRVLSCIAGGRVTRYFPRGVKPAHWRFDRRDGLRSDTITRVVNAGWARVGRISGPLSAPVELTDLGRQVLDRG